MACAVGLGGLGPPRGSAAETPPSRINAVALVEARCLSCHGPGGHGPDRSVLSRLSTAAVFATLTGGSMQQQAANLSEAERHAIADYIGDHGDAGTSHPRVEANLCGAARPAGAAAGPGSWNGWSPDMENTRFQSAPGGSLTAARVASLGLRWAFVFPDTFMAGSQPTVAGGRLYIGSFNGNVYALDAKAGCVHWTFKPEAGVRAAVVVHDGLALFGDLKGIAYGVDAATGEQRWRARLDPHPQARVTGSPVQHAGRLYVPVSSIEELAARDPKYPCCTFRGGVVALDAATGQRVWKAYTIDEAARPLGTTRADVARAGPSGVAVWSAPTIDVKRKVLYVGTGNSYTGPDPPATDAIVAFDLASGAKAWVRSLLPKDKWNTGCLEKNGTNCPEDQGPDYDFGASPVLAHLSDGRELILAGQKAGILYALDPDRQGEVRWQVQLGKGGLLGGIEWGLAVQGDSAYVAISDWDFDGPSSGGALVAVDLKTGKERWRTANPAKACLGKPKGCTTAQAAAVTVIPGVVFSGSADGHLRAYDAAMGRIVWDYDSVRDFQGVNGLAGSGGSINAAGATVSDGMVYQTSGYSMFAMPGNVLMAFGPPGTGRVR